jgi:hypothetical protein
VLVINGPAAHASNNKKPDSMKSKQAALVLILLHLGSYVCQQVPWAWREGEQSLPGGTRSQVPRRALVYIKSVVMVLVPGPLAALMSHLKQQPVVQHTRDTCTAAGTKATKPGFMC